MSSPLRGKVAIVTGGSRGIGRAIARRLGQDGADVVVTYHRDAQAAEAVVEELQALGRTAIAMQADVRQVVDIRRLFAHTQEHFGRIDIVVNNAGIADGGPLESITEEQFAALFETNVRGTLFAIQEAARALTDGGVIINLSSVVADRPSPSTAIYAATKAAVNSLTRSFAAELGPRGIRVLAVAPSLTLSDMGTNVPASFRDHTIQNTALGRLGQPDDIADVVAFLASTQAHWLTGQTIWADGGYGG